VTKDLQVLVEIKDQLHRQGQREIKGPTAPQGPKGIKGIKGPKGDKGFKGAQGNSPKVTKGSTRFISKGT